MSNPIAISNTCKVSVRGNVAPGRIGCSHCGQKSPQQLATVKPRTRQQRCACRRLTSVDGNCL
jgi:hypothetical protein